MSFARPLLRRITYHPLAAPLRPTQHLTRRSYSSSTSHGAGQSSSSLPWAAGSVAILAPGLYFIQNTRPEKTAHKENEYHSAVQINTKQPDEHASASEAVAQPDRDAEQKVTGSGSTRSSSDIPENPGRATMETDRGRSDNPYINEPGKSMKGEGETESVRIKGSVAVERPQV